VAVIPPNNNRQRNRSRKSLVNKRNHLPLTRGLSRTVRDRIQMKMRITMIMDRKVGLLNLVNGKIIKKMMARTQMRVSMRRLRTPIYILQTMTI
jgi:hypothetical protein